MRVTWTEHLTDHHFSVIQDMYPDEIIEDDGITFTGTIIGCVAPNKLFVACDDSKIRAVNINDVTWQH